MLPTLQPNRWKRARSRSPGPRPPRPGKRLRIGKIWKPPCEGKWPVTDGVKRKSYVFEHAELSRSRSLRRRPRPRACAPAFLRSVAGRLKLLSATVDPQCDLPTANAKHIADLQSWLLALDFDGLAPMKAGARLDRPEDFGDAALAEIRKRLPAAFKAVDCLLVRDSLDRPAGQLQRRAGQRSAPVSARYFCCHARCSSPSRNRS